MRTRARRHIMEERGWGKGTHHVGMIEALEHPHLTLHALLIPLDLRFWNGFQCDLA